MSDVSLGYLCTQMVTDTMGGGGHLGESLEGEDSYLTWPKDIFAILKLEMETREMEGIPL